MAVTIDDVQHVAELARLSFSAEQMEKLTNELNEILRYMEQLNSIDTTDVEPLSHVIELKNVFRDDVQRSGLTRNEALSNAPAASEKFFKVPKVIGER